MELFDVYTKEVRSLLEYAVPVWHPAISKKEASEIESIQKLAFRMILGQSYVSYANGIKDDKRFATDLQSKTSTVKTACSL